MSSFQILQQTIGSSLEALGCRIEGSEWERLVLDVAYPMLGPRRRYHDLNHALAFKDPDPVFTLAGLYHDTVYLSLDGGLNGRAQSVLKSLVRIEDKTVWVETGSDLAERIHRVFGRTSGEAQRLGPGVNEWLSALYMAMSLGPLLEPEVVVEIAACIEATIPFRESLEPLLIRLQEAGLGAERAQFAYERAVRFADTDVADFANPDPGLFLGHTWLLLPEIHPQLELTGLYDARTYRKALEGMLAFFESLEPGRIFHAVGAETLQRAQDNLSIARHYLQAKILAASLLEALALVTGGLAPLAYLMGESAGAVRSSDGALGLSAHLPPFTPRHPDPRVLNLLQEGRRLESDFDLSHSPLALFIVSHLNEEQLAGLDRQRVRFSAGDLNAEGYLAAWPLFLVRTVTEAMARAVPPRREGLQALLARLN